MYALYESLTIFFEASKASLLEVICAMDLPLKKNMGRKMMGTNKLFRSPWLLSDELDVFTLMDSVCSGCSSVLKSSSTPTFTAKTTCVNWDLYNRSSDDEYKTVLFLKSLVVEAKLKRDSRQTADEHFYKLVRWSLLVLTMAAAGGSFKKWYCNRRTNKNALPFCFTSSIQLNSVSMWAHFCLERVKVFQYDWIFMPN